MPTGGSKESTNVTREPMRPSILVLKHLPYTRLRLMEAVTPFHRLVDAGKFCRKGGPGFKLLGGRFRLVQRCVKGHERKEKEPIVPPVHSR